MFKTLLASCVGFVSAADSTTNGMTVSADTAMFQQAEMAYWAAIQNRINRVNIPDIVMPSDDEMYIKNNDFTLIQPPDNFIFTNDVANNCFQVELNKLTGKFTSSNFHAHYGILGAHGSAHMSIDSTNLFFGLRPITQTLEDGRTVPGFESCNYNFDDFSKDKLSFDLSGSFWDGFIDMFKNTFEGKIVDVLKATVKKELTETLPNELNTLLAGTDGMAQLKPFMDWYFDFETMEAGQISETSMEFGARGILFDKNVGEVLPATFPTMPYKDPAIPSELQAFVSAESVNSLFSSFLEVHPIAGWFNSTEIPAGSKFSLNTGFLDKAFKGMSDYYGPDCPVDVQFELKSIHDFAVAADKEDLTLFGDIDLKFWVESVNGTELAVDISITNFEFQGSVMIVNETELQANITMLKVKNIAVNSCAFGTIGTFKLKMGLNVALAVAAPAIAKKIDSFTIPSSILGYFEISDIIIAYYDGYLGVGATPTFIPPPLPPAPVDAHEAGTVCVKNDAGFVLKWHFEDTYTGASSHDTEHYPVGKTHCMDLKEQFPNIREGEVVKTIVKATLGNTNKAEHTTVYKADPTLFTTFTCRGTTLNYHCNDEFLDAEYGNTLATTIASFFQ